MTEQNWSSPPGDTIVRLMGMREIDGGELANALGLSMDDFEALIGGKRRLTETDATVLAEHLGSTARFWLARDKAYVLDVARLDEEGGVDQATSWLAFMPTSTSSMRKFGWVRRQQAAPAEVRSCGLPPATSSL